MSNKEDQLTPFDMAFQRLEAVIAERDHFHALYEKALEDAKHLAADRDECLEMFHSERGCCDATKAKFARAQEEIEGLRRGGYILAMRLAQSELVMDDTERAALDRFITKDNILKAVMGAQS